MSLINLPSAEDDARDALLDLQQVFSAFDKQADGPPNRLTTEKVTQILKTQLQLQPTPQHVRDCISAVDLNDSGDIQFNEFLKLMEKKPSQVKLARNLETEQELEALQFSREQLKDVFRAFDTNQDGFLSLEELRVGFEAQGQKISEDELFTLVQLVEPNNKNGQISYQAFIRMMMTPSADE